MQRQNRLRVFENRVLRKTRPFGSNRDELTVDCIMRIFVICTSHQMLLGWSYEEVSFAGHVARVGEGKARTGCWWGDLRARDHLEDPDVDRRIILKRILKKSFGRSWTGLIWLRIGTGVALMWAQYWTFGFRKLRWISWIAEELLASQEGFCYVESSN